MGQITPFCTTKGINKMAKEKAAEAAPKKTRKVEGTFAEGWKPEGEGEILAGTYLGSQDAMGKRGAFKAYHLRDREGKRWSISGANLNTVMPQIPKKTEITVTYTGTMKTDKGLDMKTFDVEIPEDTILIDPMDDDED